MQLEYWFPVLLRGYSRAEGIVSCYNYFVCHKISPSSVDDIQQNGEPSTKH